MMFAILSRHVPEDSRPAQRPAGMTRRTTGVRSAPASGNAIEVMRLCICPGQTEN
jgi:hypothetical protein